MTTKIKEYHRSFLYYPSRSGPSTSESLYNLGHPGAIPAQTNSQPRENVRDRYTGVSTIQNTTRYHKALEIAGSQLREITIMEKGDQKFESWATPWERTWSPLARSGKKALLPVVDQNAMVVGYSGPVLSSEILIGRPTWLALIYSAEEILKYHRMFLGAKALQTVPDLSVYGDGLNYYAVMTDIYGEVTSFQFAYPSSNGTAESTGFPGLAWLKILQGGLRIIMSVRNGFRTVGRQPPAPSPKPQNALPAGPSTNVPKPAQGGTLPYNTQPSLPGPASVQPPSVQPGLRTSINLARRQLGLPPLSSAKEVDELWYRARNVRAHKEVMEWLDKNPNSPWPEKVQVLNGIYQRWRVSGLPGDG